MMAVKYRIALVAGLILVCSTGAFALNRADLEQVATRMSAAAGRTFDIRIEPDSTLNAYADQSGRLAVTSGMLEALLSQDELAFVLGHEMTHVIKGHVNGQMEHLTLGAILGLAVGVLLKAKGDDLVSAAQAGAMLVNGDPSRSNEYASDEGGIRLAVKAGFDPQGGVQAMSLLLSRYGRGDAGVPVIGWFASHPDTKNRVLRLEKLAKELEAQKPASPVPAVAPVPNPRLELRTSLVGKPAEATQAPVVVVEATNVDQLPPAPEVTVTDPSLMFRFGDITTHMLKGTETLSVEGAPKGTSKVIYRLFGADGNLATQGETSLVSPALCSLSTEMLAKYGKRLRLEAIALDGAGREIDRATITIIVQ